MTICLAPNWEIIKKQMQAEVCRACGRVDMEQEWKSKEKRLMY